MCGVNGIFAYHYAANPIERGELVRTRDYMAARGPDAAGDWVSDDSRIGFGHRRLAIIDLSEGGTQPMVSADGRYVVTFNGEIYNYVALRKFLIAKGHIFKSQSDTEVLLHLYAEKGAAMVNDLRGMFSFAIFDGLTNTLFLARDAYGVKPLYYADDGRTFRFASQVKALLAGGGVSRDPEPAGVVGFYLWGSVPEPFTIYRSIRSLAAGCTLTVKSDAILEPRQYYSIAQVYRTAEGVSTRSANSDARAEIREALLDSVRHHLVADVPVGAFLSAGVDSSALVGLMRDRGQKTIKTVTLAFDEFSGSLDDERPLAEEVSRLYGTDHTTRVVTRAEFTSDLPNILEAMDQPSIDGINTWFVSKAAHELGLKVAISGLGGDELFGSYPSFRDIPRWVRCMSTPFAMPGLGRMLRQALVATKLDNRLVNPKGAGMLELGGTFAGAYMLRRGLYMPWELGAVLDPETIRLGIESLQLPHSIEMAITPCPRSSFAIVASMEASLYMRNQLLRDTDWASMAHSLEVRVPLVDTSLLARIAPHVDHLASSIGKVDLATAPSVPVPDKIVGRRKTGFSVPLNTWRQKVSDADWITMPAQRRGMVARDWARVVMAGQAQ